MLEFRERQIWNTHYQDFYAPYQGAVLQAEQVFILGNNLRQRFAQCRDLFVIGELGFGTGANFCHTVEVFLKEAAQNTRLFYAACEKNPLTKEQLKKCHEFYGIKSLISAKLIDCWPEFPYGFEYLSFFEGRITLLLLVGDAQEVWQEFSGVVDAWYFDGFSPEKNPEMWDTKLFSKLKELSFQETTFATYSVARKVKEAILKIGGTFEKKMGLPGKKEILVGKLNGLALKKLSYPKEVTVVGGGIAGSSVAFSFSRRGVLVKLFEKNSPIQGASAIPTALLMPMVGHPKDALVSLSRKSFFYTKNLIKAFPWSIPCEIQYIPVRRLEKKIPELTFSYKKAQSLAGYPTLLFSGALVSTKPFLDFLQKNTNLVLLKQNFSLTKKELKSNLLIWCTGKDLKEHQLPVNLYWGELFSFPDLAQNAEEVYVAKNYLYYFQGIWHLGATYSLEKPELQTEKAFPLLAEMSKFFGINWNFKEKPKVWLNQRTVSQDRLPILGPNLKDQNQFFFGAFGSRGFSQAPFLAEVLAAYIFREPLPIEKSLCQKILIYRFFKNQVMPI